MKNWGWVAPAPSGRGASSAPANLRVQSVAVPCRAESGRRRGHTAHRQAGPLLSGYPGNPIHGGVNYLNTNCFTPPIAPASLPVATTANPYGCAPSSFPAFAGAPPSGTQFCSNVLGNTRRNQFYGPGLTTVDFSVFKNTKIPSISETFNLQFRAEFFNLLNHTNFLSPGFLNTFGQNNSVVDFDGSSLPTALNQTSTTSRQIQLGLKVIW